MRLTGRVVTLINGVRAVIVDKKQNRQTQGWFIGAGEDEDDVNKQRRLNELMSLHSKDILYNFSTDHFKAISTDNLCLCSYDEADVENEFGIVSP